MPYPEIRNANVRVTWKDLEPHVYLDGVDITNMLVPDGLDIEWPSDIDAYPKVTLTLAADVECDLTTLLRFKGASV